MQELRRKLTSIIDKETDSVIFYALCAACVARKSSIGVDVFKEEREFRII